MNKTKAIAKPPGKAAQTPPMQKPSMTPTTQHGLAMTARDVDVMRSTAQGGMSLQRAGVMRSAQQSIGNARLARMLNAQVQTKLTVSKPNDIYEKEADRVANAVTGPANKAANQTGGLKVKPQDEEKTLQSEPIAAQITPLVRKRADVQPVQASSPQAAHESEQAGVVSPAAESQINASKGNGQTLARAARNTFEPQFGADFSDVQIHADAKSDALNRELNARAFTTGKDIFFKQGEYDTNSVKGQKLLAHELTHVVQQQKASSSVMRQSGKTGSPGRIVPSVTMKRKNISLKGEDKYGHWWTELGSESYGWWPKYPVGLWETLTGVAGELNGVTSFGGSSTKDPHHGDSADEQFNPRVKDAAKPDAQVEAESRAFAKAYSGEWRWTLGWGQNCRTFQEALMSTVGLERL